MLDTRDMEQGTDNRREQERVVLWQWQRVAYTSDLPEGFYTGDALRPEHRCVWHKMSMVEQNLKLKT